MSTDMYYSPQGPILSHPQQNPYPTTPTRTYQQPLYQARTPVSAVSYSMDQASTSYAPSTPSASNHHSSPYPPSAGSNYIARQPYTPHGSTHMRNLSSNVSPNLAPPMGGSGSGGSGSSIGSRGITVMEFMSYEGSQGTQIDIRCEVNFPPSPPTIDSKTSIASNGGKALRIVFGTNPVPTKVTILPNNSSSGGQICQCTATAPSHSSTGSNHGGLNRVAVYVQALAETHAIVETVQVGNFTYVNTGARAGYSVKRAGEALENHRPSPSLVHRRVMSAGGTYQLPDGPYGIKEEYNQGVKDEYHSSPVGPDPNQWQRPYNGPTNVSAPPPYNPDAAGLQPSLMRTTQLGPGPVHPAPYVTMGSKANLELTGDLKTMSSGWTTEEWHSRRRLVQFWRRQEGTSIHAAFRPVSLENYVQNSIVISCIFREDKNECYVTSVDAIYLLEALVGVRFTVEEKNRIRRNLEGFRPITVSKNKLGSEDFFKLIMGFPNPKPRNIEKDVKVFPWDIFGSALKKIIGKYSANYTFAQNGNMAPPQNPLPPSGNPYNAPPSMDYAPHPPPPIPHPAAHSSSDSSNFASTNSYPNPATPQSRLLHHSNSHEDSPTQYRNSDTSLPSLSHSHSGGGFDEKHADAFVNYSPEAETYHNQYPQPYNQNGQGRQWSNQNIGTVDNPVPSPSVSAASYATLPAVYHDQQAHQLPHVHQSLPRHPSSNDLRVMYPAL